MSNFKVTKALIEAYVNNGFTVRMMAEDITKQSGVKCSDAVVKAACKTYGVNLRTKKNPSHFVFEDLDTTKVSDVAKINEGPVALVANEYIAIAVPVEVE